LLTPQLRDGRRLSNFPSTKVADTNIVICSIITLSYIAITLAAAEILDGSAVPRRRGGRAPESLHWRLLVTLVIVGAGLFATGNPLIACAITIALSAALTIGSNLKNRALGEPLLFSDLAVLGAFVRYPGFYLAPVPPAVRVLALGGVVALAVTIACGSTTRMSPHLLGLALMVTAAPLLAIPILSPRLMRRPNVVTDFRRHGLRLTLLVYAFRWRRERRPMIAAPLPQNLSADLVIVVQCESFTDPTTLREDAQTLPSLARARTAAWQRGRLMVSGFGAYTMRTEYGVLFGQGEPALGFRRYDPFLTARRDASHALSAKLSGRGYGCVFLHPHDLRFYARDNLMPAIGFGRMVGSEACAPSATATGPYVSDAAVGAAVREIVTSSTGKTFIYAVTMENHGPWQRGRMGISSGGFEGYLSHLRHSDALLEDLIMMLSASGRSAVLAFFGDHRPSIPGVVEPGGDRHTPYVLMRFDAGGSVTTSRQADLTPAELHHAILDCAA
jgi:hypothetical protein